MIKLLSTILLSALFATQSVQAEPKTVRVSAVQYLYEGKRTEEQFFSKMEKWIGEAKQKKSDLVVFPELIAHDVKKNTETEKELVEIPEIAKNFTPKYYKFIQAQAKKTKMMILGGTAPRLTSTGSIRNTAILAFPDGTAVFQDKLFLTPDEVDWKWETGEELQVFTHPKLGRFVIAICYDSEFPQVSNMIARANPSLILVPSMTGYKGYKRVRFTSQARAVEHFAYVVVVGTVSPKDAANTDDVGQAVIIPPQETGFPDLVAEGPYNLPAVVTGEIDLKLLHSKKATVGIFPARDGNARKAPMELKEVNL